MEALKKKMLENPKHYPQFSSTSPTSKAALSQQDEQRAPALPPPPPAAVVVVPRQVDPASVHRSKPQVYELSSSDEDDSDDEVKVIEPSSSRPKSTSTTNNNATSSSNAAQQHRPTPPSTSSSSSKPLFSTASSFFPSSSSSSKSKPPPTSFFDAPANSFNQRPPPPNTHRPLAPNNYNNNNYNSSSSQSQAFSQPPKQLPYGYVPNKTPAVIPGGLFPIFGSSSSSASNAPVKYKSAFPPEKKEAPPKVRREEDEGETFDVDIRPTSNEDFERVDDADKHMRELLEGALGEEVEVDEEDATVEGFRPNVQLMPHQIQGVAWMKGRESGRKTGGILADDMGLGKTVQTLARIVQGKPTSAHKKAGFRGGTLVVCPLAVMEQWKDEVKKKTTKGFLKVTTHHGPGRFDDAHDLEKYDVIITTYQVVASEHANFLALTAKDEDNSDSDTGEEFGDSLKKAKKTKAKAVTKKKKASANPLCALFRVKWHRIVLDEAQNIKNRTTKAAKACIELSGKFRWCLTGTPIQNNVDELFSLFAFLRCRPLDDWDSFREQISKPVKAGRTKYAMKKLQVILKAIMLRRLKTAEINGKRILNLPERNVQVVTCVFDKDERAFYQALAEKTALTMSKFMKSGTVMSNYTSILTMLLRLRQACDHPVLVSKSFASDPDAIAPKASNPAKEDSDEADDLADLFGGLGVAKTLKCTICSSDLDKGVKDFCSDGCRSIARRAREGTVEGTDTPPSSAKIREIRRILKDVREKGEGGEKTIIFSQFTSMLDIIEPFLRRDRHKFVRYDGSMVDAKRQISLEAIKSDPETKVILISFKAGSTGLNLTCANHVILVDLWWNPALEDQAFDRAHRLGQTRDVEIYKLAIEESVEDRILELQDKKRELAAAALSGDKFKAGNKLGLEDIMALFKPYHGVGNHPEDSDSD